MKERNLIIKETFLNLLDFLTITIKLSKMLYWRNLEMIGYDIKKDLVLQMRLLMLLWRILGYEFFFVLFNFT